MTCFKAGVLYDKSAGTICVLSTFFNFIFFFFYERLIGSLRMKSTNSVLAWFICGICSIGFEIRA